jgi:branched-chain amino acid transport system substrate-binding protein
VRTLSLLTLFLASLVLTLSARAEDIVIGGGLVLSGPYASYGTDARLGADIAVDEINQSGGVFGRPLRVDYDDTGGDRAKAVAIYRKFAARPEVALALLITSFEFVAVNPVSRETGLPFISIGSVIPFTDFSPYAFRINLILSNAMGSVLDKLKAKGAKRIAVIYDQVNNQCVAEAEIVRKSLAVHGLEIAGVESYSTGEQNFTLQLARIQKTNPDILWLAGTTDEGALIISQARALGMTLQIIGGAGLNDPRIGQLSGGAGKGAMTFALFDSSSSRPAVKHFLELFHAKYKDQSPPAYAALGYDAIGLIASAIKRAGSADRAAITKTLGQTKDYDGVDGPFSYAGSGDNQSQSPMILIYGDKGYAPLAE